VPKLGVVHVLDHDVRRRASVARQLMELGHHAELYDGLGELSARPPGSGLLLVFDDASRPVFPGAAQIVENNGSYVPVALYSDDIRPEKIVAVMMSGALGYLGWPFDPATLGQSLDRIAQAARVQEARRRNIARARLLIQRLSKREHEVLRALVNGASSHRQKMLKGSRRKLNKMKEVSERKLWTTLAETSHPTNERLVPLEPNHRLKRFYPAFISLHTRSRSHRAASDRPMGDEPRLGNPPIRVHFERRWP